MTIKVEIPIKLPSLNEYINICRGNKYRANSYKTDIENQIGWYLIRVPKFNNPVWLHFHWVEANKKRDIDNIAFAKKFILDEMVHMGILHDDGWQYVAGFNDTFEIGNETKVILYIDEEEN